MSRMSLADLQRRVAALHAPWESWFEGKEFTADWTSPHFGVWSQVLAPFRREGLRVLEIGSFEGRSAIFWLEYLPACHVTCVDKYSGTKHVSGEIEARFDRNLAPYGERVRKIKGASAEVLPQLANEDARFDLIYVDGSHKRDNVMIDSVMSWWLLKPGGMLIFDDYLHDLHKEPAEQPKEAIDVFLRWHAEELDEVHRGYQIIVRRKTDEAEAQRK